MTQTEAIKLAIEWIEKQPEEITASKYDVNSRYVVLRELEAALAQPDQDEVDIRSRLYQRIHELETQLAREEQEPVAYIHRNEFNEYRLEPTDNFKITDLPVGVEMMLYTTPPQRKPLTDEQIWDLHIKMSAALNCKLSDLIELTRAVEAAHGIKE